MTSFVVPQNSLPEPLKFNTQFRFMATRLSLEVIQNDLIGFLRESITSENLEFNVDTPLSSLGIDSFNLIQIILFIERHFKISLPDTALTEENLRTVATVALCVHNTVQ